MGVPNPNVPIVVAQSHQGIGGSQPEIQVGSFHNADEDVSQISEPYITRSDILFGVIAKDNDTPFLPTGTLHGIIAVSINGKIYKTATGIGGASKLVRKDDFLAFGRGTTDVEGWMQRLFDFETKPWQIYGITFKQV
jgi:hypothetical protein